MKLLQKILLVVMGVVGENVDVYGMAPPAPPLAAAVVGANVLDFNIFPDNTPNIPAFLQPKLYHPGGWNALNNNLEYVYFTVIPNAPVAAAQFINPAVVTPIANPADFNIFFPADGSQPTTPEAVEYSCANIDNRENSPITEWYMMMFGVIHFQGDGTGANDYIKAGWNNVAPPVAQQIITFPILPVLLPVHLLGHNPIDGTNVPDPDIPGNITRTALFERKFRKIASTSVGRMLLYRILIEIRRHTAAGNNAGRLEGIITPPVIGMILRNSNRCISIYSGVKSSYNSNRQKIRIREINKRHTIIGKTTAHNDDGHTAIGTSESSIDISLFHEMTHWYHTLRDPKRKNKEVADFDDDDLNLRNYHLGAYYWSGLDNCITKWGADRMIISQNGWGNFEEMRTILGVPYGGSVHQYTGGDNIYKEGDDLSENLYRVCIGSPIRFGHSRNDFYEDRKVINKVINAVNESHMFYIKGYIAPVSPFNNPNRRNGLGDCRK